MGKQIRFFMTELDERSFVKVISEYGNIILDDKASIVTQEAVSKSKLLKFFIAYENTNIIFFDGGFINSIRTEVIEFSRCKEWSDKVLSVGRIWVELKYYDDTRQRCTKNANLNDMYNIYVKWIKKHFKISKCKDYYIGPDAYRKYKDEGYIMKAGPKYVVEFE